MSMDRTLRSHGSLLRTRSVLTRAERIEKMIEEGKFDPETDRPTGLPKMRVRHSKAGSKSKKAAEEVPVEGAEGAAGEGVAAAEDAAKPEAPAGKEKSKGKGKDRD